MLLELLPPARACRGWLYVTATSLPPLPFNTAVTTHSKSRYLACLDGAPCAKRSGSVSICGVLIVGTRYLGANWLTRAESQSHNARTGRLPI